MPASYHIAQEIQKYNIPDYRPRQTQYAISYTLIDVRDSMWPVLDSRMRSKRFVPSNGCDEIVASRLVRRRIQRDRTSRGSFVLTIHLKHTHDRRAIDYCCLF